MPGGAGRRGRPHGRAAAHRVRPVLRLLGLAAALVALPAATRDWSQVANRRPDGAFVLGNPAAPVKVVEYLSLTCPHCAKMEADAIPPFTAKYVRTGRASYEVRHALRDPFDFAASILARCAGPAAFFKAAPAVYAAQPTWFETAAKWSQTAPKGLTPDKALPAAATGAGLDRFFAARGLPPARQTACFADADERKLLSQMADEAWNRPNFPGTPAFLVNGKMVEAASWADLDAGVAAALPKP